MLGLARGNGDDRGAVRWVGVFGVVVALAGGMNDVPCWRIRPDGSCYLGINTALDCIGCTNYDDHPDPTPQHYIVWHEIRNGVGTRTDSDNNQPGGRERF
jgi:hypothetical protein